MPIKITDKQKAANNKEPLKNFFLKLLNEWDISYDEYVSGEWGMVQGNNIKIPQEYAIRFRNRSTGSINLSRVFREVAILVISYIKVRTDNLQDTPYYMLEDDTQAWLKAAVYQCIEYRLENGGVNEILEQKTFTTPQFSAEQRGAGEFIFIDRFIGNNAMMSLKNSGLLTHGEYLVIPTGEYGEYGEYTYLGEFKK